MRTGSCSLARRRSDELGVSVLVKACEVDAGVVESVFAGDERDFAGDQAAVEVVEARCIVKRELLDGTPVAAIITHINAG